MASTSKTATLKLNQWVPSDPVLREDFNADNAKLDAAIQAIPLALLKRGTLTADAATLSVNLSELDLTQYKALRLVANPISSGTSFLYFTMNNLSSVSDVYVQSTHTGSNTFCNSATLCANQATMSGSTVITVDISLTNQLPGSISYRGNPYGNEATYFYVNNAYLSKSNLVNLQFIFLDSSYLFKAGSQYSLYGLKG